MKYQKSVKFEPVPTRQKNLKKDKKIKTLCKTIIDVYSQSFNFNFFADYKFLDVETKLRQIGVPTRGSLLRQFSNLWYLSRVKSR